MNNTLYNFTLFFMRLVPSLAMLYYHGAAKVSMVFAGKTQGFPDPLGMGSGVSLYIATFAETLCPALIILGVFTRSAALIACVNMAVAVWYLHTQAGASFELAVLYLAFFAAIAFAGAGEWSVDGAKSWSGWFYRDSK
ncbi:MAG: DoxX family protein [Candidatus Merdousia sp.]|nr:DoxX family protein [Candidatus Merdousia sp.]